MSEPYIRIRDLVKHYETPSGSLPILQGVDLEAVLIPPESTTVFYRNLPPKDQYSFSVETKDETGLWSSGENTAERRFTVNYDPETYLDSLWISGPYVESILGDSIVPIPLWAAEHQHPPSARPAGKQVLEQEVTGVVFMSEVDVVLGVAALYGVITDGNVTHLC